MEDQQGPADLYKAGDRVKGDANGAWSLSAEDHLQSGGQRSQCQGKGDMTGHLSLLVPAVAQPKFHSCSVCDS